MPGGLVGVVGCTGAGAGGGGGANGVTGAAVLTDAGTSGRLMGMGRGAGAAALGVSAAAIVAATTLVETGRRANMACDRRHTHDFKIKEC